jgi:hypothetical protein
MLKIVCGIDELFPYDCAIDQACAPPSESEQAKSLPTDFVDNHRQQLHDTYSAMRAYATGKN